MPSNAQKVCAACPAMPGETSSGRCGCPHRNWCSAACC